jgi:hypothetical protein
MLKLVFMKSIFITTALFFSLAASAQVQQPAKGVSYGTAISADGQIVTADDLKSRLVNDAFEGKVKGTVAEVCAAEGCWLRLKRADGTTMMVRAKDHSFVVPTSLVGKTVVVEGTATVKEISEELRKHYAEDAGKSKKEIAKIKGPEKDVQLNAKGLLVLD